ncbi:hypothetical protein AWJ20_4784 [Sugiyamaella lignohabitans]|uniref:Uncharacterized protein n=1 Tax=Sugiyamaella lignohabitans TaxID=796027 RepID=A0A161HKY9_9ASCO|nr:uncharacterized protein AWJ20_4784 [Sugiyamaella lignohabitans]ANB13837.1 hypothetical protein AWJ20_4784 [Sugiyamaella lignohabitans]
MSVNMVFDAETLADGCLDALTSEAVYYEGTSIKPTEIRPAKPYPFKEGVTLTVRQAFESDRKIKGARARSRYYLFNGEPTRAEDELRFGLDDYFEQAGKGPNSSSNRGYRDDRRSRYRDRDGRRGRDRDQDDDGDLFPLKAGEFRESIRGSDLRGRDSGSDRDRNYDRRPAKRGKSYRYLDRNRSRSPGRDSADEPTPSNDSRSRNLSDRLDTPWVKGDLLEKIDNGRDELADRLDLPRTKDRRNRRKAADLF